MPTITDAVNSLKEDLRNGGVEKHVQDAFNHLAPYLILLDSSFPSVQMIRKLCTVLRQPLLPLYNACLQPALQLSCVVLSAVLGKLCDAQDVGGENLSAAWNATAEVILSGVLDFLEQKDGGDVQSDVAVWEVLNRIVCEFFFHDSGRVDSVFSISLCLSAFNTLTETATRQVTVWNALHHKTTLGGEKLGAAISRTRDYLVLEALLMLFARLLPPISQGKSERTKFVKEVFGSPKLFKCHAELLEIMQKTNKRHWDDIAAQIIDLLARNDITYPQPFSIDEIVVCGRVFPQPLATDRLIVDRQAFLANIVLENDDQCESLQVPYSRIRTITLDNSNHNVPEGRVSIMVYLTSPPLVTDVELNSPGESHLYAKFFLQHDELARFMEALRRRGVGKLSFLNPLTRVKRTHKSISIGSGFKFINDSSPIPPTASFEGKVQHVNQVYKTDAEDLAMSEVTPGPRTRDTCSSPISVLEPALKDEKLVPEIHQSAVCEDDPVSPHSAALISSASRTSKPTQNFSFSLPGDSTLFGDGDELSEISEFKPDDPTINEQAATVSLSHSNQDPKPARSKINCTPIKGSTSITSVAETGKSFDCSLKNGDHIEGVSQSREPWLASESPIFASSSSTRINVSPKPRSNADTLLTPVGIKIVGGLSAPSHDFVSKDVLKKTVVDEAALSRTKLVITSAGQPQIGSNSTEDELGQRTEHVTASSGANQQAPSRTKITGDMSTPSKIPGRRRKRETINSLSTAEVDDESTPRKKHRNDRLGIRDDKDKSDETLKEAISIPRVKRRTKMAKGSGRGHGTTAFHVERSPGLPHSCQGTRKSSRIRRRQVATTGGGRANSMHGETQKEKKANDSNVNTTRQGTTPTPSVITDSALSKADNMQPLIELRSAENTIPEMNLPHQTLKSSSLPSKPGITPVKEQQRGFDRDIAQQAVSVSDTTQLYTKNEEIMDDQYIMSDPCGVYNDICQAQETVEHSLCANDSGNSLKFSRPIVQSTPLTKAVTIDLTTDDSPAGEKNRSHKTSAILLQSEANNPTKFATPDQSGHIVPEESPFASTPQPRRRNVTFASPIEYVLDKKVKLKTRSSPPTTRQSFSVSESNTLSPLRIPTETGTANMKSGPANQIQTQKSKLLQEDKNTTDEVGIQDIVGVLNEIHAAIVKGISDKSRNVKKQVQRSRDELIQQVLDELQGMVVENAKYFNELLRLEEDYYKNGRAVTRCWEELINTNDCIAEHVQKALKEHDQNITARSFPKSFLPRKPGFLSRRANA